LVVGEYWLDAANAHRYGDFELRQAMLWLQAA
jgi:hypothetical protein